MQDLMLWHDDDERPSRAPAQAAASSLPTTFETSVRPPTPIDYRCVWFTDIWDHRIVRKGRILRTITVPDRFVKPHAQPATIVLELVAYSDETGAELLDVIWPSRHANPKPPTI